MPRETPFTFAYASPAEALAALIGQIRPVDSEPIPLDVAAGRVLAQDVESDRPSPPFDVSSMDGYAVRAADCNAGELPIAGEVRIGSAPPQLPGNAAIRIVTGGAMPAGADAVIKREDVTEYAVRIVFQRSKPPRVGDNIRRIGENMAAGSLVSAKGARITAAVAGALAAFGCSLPRVYQRVRVRIITTGDELVAHDKSPGPFQLRDSNAIALLTLLRPHPFVEVDHVHVRDDQPTMNAAVAEALTSSDALLLTGGVSMGHRDFVSDALAANNVRTLFHGLPQRPGKPILGGVTGDSRPVLALPGNPVSVMVTARRIALPAILARGGAVSSSGTTIAGCPSLVTLTNPDSKPIDLFHHRLVQIVGLGSAELVDAKSSGDLTGAARADGFIEVPPQQSGPGPWPFYPWTS